MFIYYQGFVAARRYRFDEPKDVFEVHFLIKNSRVVHQSTKYNLKSLRGQRLTHEDLDDPLISRLASGIDLPLFCAESERYIYSRGRGFDSYRGQKIFSLPRVVP